MTESIIDIFNQKVYLRKKCLKQKSSAYYDKKFIFLLGCFLIDLERNIHSKIFLIILLLNKALIVKFITYRYIHVEFLFGKS